MKKSIFKLLILCNAFLLALPPGSCCGSFGAHSATPQGELSPAVPSCCQHSSAHHPETPLESQSPFESAGECCCDYDAILAANASVPKGIDMIVGDVFGEIVSKLSAEVFEFSVVKSGLQNSLLFSTYTPAYVLNCVWLC